MSEILNDSPIWQKLGCTEQNYWSAVEKSIIDSGSKDARLSSFVQKLKDKKPVYIAAIGGSVTEGAGAEEDKDYTKGYASQFVKKLGELYPESEITFNGAGLSGTPALLGILRYEKDIVIPYKKNPDLLIVEFAVNGSGSEQADKYAFEGLIRRVLSVSTDTCVIALYADAKSYKNSQPLIDPVAEYYRIPRISIQNVVENPDFGIEEDKFFWDYVHPHTCGHTFMADCLIKLIQTAVNAKNAAGLEAPSDAFPSKPLCETDISSIIPVLRNNDAVLAGSFNGTDENTQSLKKGGTEFPVNWHHVPGNQNNESLKFSVECRYLLFIYKVQGNWLPQKFGSADVYIDGKKVKTFNGGENSAGAWNNCVNEILFDEEKSSLHTVEVKMVDGDVDKGFTILAMGYVK